MKKVEKFLLLLYIRQPKAVYRNQKNSIFAFQYLLIVNGEI